MKKNIKLVLGFLMVLGTFMVPAFSQQITKFAVVDTAKIYSAYFKDTSAVRKYEQKKVNVQTELDKLTKELYDLKQVQGKLMKSGDREGAQKIDKEIKEKHQYVLNYAKVKQQELDQMEKALEANDDFYKKLNKTLAKVAESGGYSMVLSLQDDNAILWFSSSVDITNDVIKELGL